MYNHYAIIILNVSSLLKFDCGPCFYLCWFSKRWNIHTSLEKQKRHIFVQYSKNCLLFKCIHLEVSIFYREPEPQDSKILGFFTKDPNRIIFCAISQKLKPRNYKPKCVYTTHLPHMFQQINDISPPSFSGPKKHTVGRVRTLRNPSLSQKNLSNSQRLSVLLAIQPFTLRLMAKTTNRLSPFCAGNKGVPFLGPFGCW